MDMILSSCGTCQGGHGETILDTTRNGKGAPAKKASMSGVRADVDDKTHVSFPIIGNMEDEKYLKNFVFIPMVQSPGIAFITLANKVEEKGIVLSAVKKCWPVLLLSLTIAFIAAVLIWLSVSYCKLCCAKCFSLGCIFCTKGLLSTRCFLA